MCVPMSASSVWVAALVFSLLDCPKAEGLGIGWWCLAVVWCCLARERIGYLLLTALLRCLPLALAGLEGAPLVIDHQKQSCQNQKHA